jgi:aminomethyltransferase
MMSVEFAEIGAEVEVITASGPVHAKIVERPFYDPQKKLAAA